MYKLFSTQLIIKVFNSIKNNLISLFTVLFFFLLSNCSSSNKRPVFLAESHNKKLNVLFIIADDLNCDIGVYGNKVVKTPNIDRLIENGTLFLNAHCQYPLCGPSRASFMTGMYSNQTKMTKNNIFLRNTVPDVITIGQRFRQQGYQSVRIGKIFHYDNPSTIGTSGIDDIYSWDQTINPYGRDKIEEYKINTLSPRRYGGTLSWMASDGVDEEQTDGIGASEAIKKLENFSNTGEKFFLAVGFFRPHTPFVAPKKYFDLYSKEDIEIPKSSPDYLRTIPIPAAKSVRAKKNQINLEEDLAKEIKQAYYATISFVDAQVGRIINKLKQTGLDKNTIVVFTSDHGYHMGEHGHWQKQTLFNNATKVPLIINVPGEDYTSKISKSPVELIDIFPTLMDLTNIITPSHVVGQSLKPIIENKSSDVRKNALTRWSNGYSIMTDRFRLTKWDINGDFQYELYDHKFDEQELNNLALDSSYSSICDSLIKTINLRIAQADMKPEGLGRQIENVKPIPRITNVTYGDIYNENGNRTFLKPISEKNE
jgi:arylsulfatase A-like enzyme